MKYCSKCMNPIEETDVECPFCGSVINAEIPSHHLAPGTILNNKFLVGAALGEGGFGITYIGRDTKLDMKVAIKEYYPNGYVNRSNTISPAVNISPSGERKEFFDTGRERFLREAQILAKFSGSTGIVDVRDFFEENNTAYIVMEYLDGQTLKDYLKDKGTLTPEQTIRLLMPVMESLKKIHTQGLIHRDISPDNIMLVDGHVKLLDFGAARNVSAAANKSLSVTLKPGYAPEEQYRSKGDQGPWTDVYALCATMYKCITGITPDDSTQRVFSDELKTPSALGINIDPVIEEALLKGLNVMQKDRYQNIDELLNGLKGINTVGDDDSKTIYGGVPAVEDDKPTEYRAPGSEDKTFSGNRDVTHSEPKKEPTEDKQKEPERVEYKESERAEKIEKPISNTPVNGDNSSNDPIKKPRKEKKKKKRLVIILLSAVLVIVAIVGISTIFGALNSVTIGGEKVSKNDTRVVVDNVTVTVDDMKAIISMGKLESILFSNCVIDNSTIKYLSDISAPITKLDIRDCSGFDDYSSISDLKYLRYLYITECNLTNEQLKGIKFENKEYLQEVDLSENAELSDLTPLSSVKLLNKITVDKTSVRDFSALKECEILQYVSAQDCGIIDVSSLTNKAISHLYLNNNEISDISSFANFEAIRTLEISNNKISDISALADHKFLTTLYLDGNQINSISALDSTPSLTWLQISDNQIPSLAPLSNAEQLGYLYVNRNKLTNLDGLENALKLKVLQATENEIENINGIANCTILEEFNINANKVSDISLLKKSAATLVRVFFNGNSVSDISCFEDASKLEYLSFDYNKVTTLDSLSKSTALVAISAEYNEITSMEGLVNSTKLKYIYLPHNNIESMTPVANLAPRAENDFAVIDLSSNNISELSLTSNKEYSYLAVYNNPITSFAKVAEVKGRYFLFSYVDGMDLTGFDKAFNYYNVIDCPKDKQVTVEGSIKDIDVISITSGVTFSTVEEADQQTRDAKNTILLGSTAPKEESAE